MQHGFAAAAERHAAGRGNDRERRVFHRLHHRLALADQVVDHRPQPDIGGEQREADIGADRKVLRLVMDDQRLHLLADVIQGLLQQPERILVECVHLAVELEAGDAVADVPQRRRGVLEDRLGRQLDVGEQQHALAALDRMIDAIGAEVVEPAAVDLVEATGLRRAIQ